MLIATTFLSLALQVPPRDFREEKLGQFSPVAVLEVTPSMRFRSEVFSIYAPFTGPRERGERYLAIRRVVTRSQAPASDEWIVASQCPGAVAVLLDLEKLQPPQIDIPTIGRDDKQGPGLDGTSYELFVRSPTWSDSYAYDMTFSTNLGSPLATWADQLKTILEPCWASERPPAWGDGASRRE